jgi:hypothetical protein
MSRCIVNITNVGFFSVWAYYFLTWLVASCSTTCTTTITTREYCLPRASSTSSCTTTNTGGVVTALDRMKAAAAASAAAKEQELASRSLAGRTSVLTEAALLLHQRSIPSQWEQSSPRSSSGRRIPDTGSAERRAIALPFHCAADYLDSDTVQTT